MVERLATFVEGWALNDFYAGTEVGQVGEPEGFEAGVLVRLPEPTSVDDANDGQQLLWGNGDLGAAQPEGWALSVAQLDAENWTMAFEVADTGGAVETLIWDMDNTELPVAERSMFVHGVWNPTGGGNGDIGLFVNGLLVATADKALTPRPATTPPRIGNGVVADPGTPPIEPRLSIAGVCYRTGSLGLNNHARDVFEYVQEVDDVAQLPAEGAFQWDNIWSARRRLPTLRSTWNDLTDSVALERNGNGGSLRVGAAKAHFWNQ